MKLKWLTTLSASPSSSQLSLLGSACREQQVCTLEEQTPSEGSAAGSHSTATLPVTAPFTRWYLISQPLTLLSSEPHKVETRQPLPSVLFI